MGAIEAYVNASKPATLKTTGLQLNKSSGGVTKPRVIHTYSPRVYKIQPEEFLELVQKLTGNPVEAQPKRPTRTIQFFENDHAANSKSENSWFQQSSSAAQSNVDFATSTGEVLGSPYTRNILGALPSPSLVTLNFLPLLTTPRARTT